MKPKGTILIIGGAEDMGDGKKEMQELNNGFEQFEILKELLPKNRKKQKIEIVTTASGVPAEIKNIYERAFGKIGYPHVGFLDIRDKIEAREPEFSKRIKAARAVFFAGGDQFKLAAILGGTEMVSVLKEKYLYDHEFVVAGTSAGAMALAKVMIYEGGVQEALLKDDLKISSGLGIFDTCIIDTHFVKRGRFGRLAHAITMNPEALGIGLGEDTALIIKNGFDAECRGSGMVIIIDGNGIKQTNITEIENNDPIYVENLKVHILAKGCRFNMKDREMVHTGISGKRRQTKSVA